MWASSGTIGRWPSNADLIPTPPTHCRTHHPHRARRLSIKSRLAVNRSLGRTQGLPFFGWRFGSALGAPKPACSYRPSSVIATVMMEDRFTYCLLFNLQHLLAIPTRVSRLPSPGCLSAAAGCAPVEPDRTRSALPHRRGSESDALQTLP